MATLPDLKGVDPATIIHHSILAWQNTFGGVHVALRDACHVLRQDSGLYELCFKVFRSDRQPFTGMIPINILGPEIVSGQHIRKWGMQKLGPGVWTLSRSIHIEGAYHGYVVLVDVPDPAPWQHG